MTRAYVSVMPVLTYLQVVDGNAMSSSYVIVRARAGRIRAMLQSLRYTSVRFRAFFVIFAALIRLRFSQVFRK